MNPEITSALLATVDAVRFMLAQIEATGEQGNGDYRALIAELTRLNDAAQTGPATTPDGETDEPAVMPDVAPPVAVITPEATGSTPSAAAVEPMEARNSSVSESTIRVDVGLLDKLMNLVGELVLARNQILQFTGQSADTALLATSQRLNLITTELQGSVMKTRMQPIGTIWDKLPRVVRDLAASCGKQVRLQMEGKETELDKTIIEAIKDPLTHIVRNSVDHGIERPEVRTAAGKTAEGLLKLRAYHEGGQVNIEITDDGAGIDPARLKQKALQRGLITGEQAARMSEGEALQLIFLPGFSTAEKVTNVSGRGVGMDVVKTNIEKIGGTVDLQSRVGAGTTLKIKIPLTLAIIPALIVTSGCDRFAIPQVNLLELVRLERGDGRDRIERIHGTPVYRLRGNLLPLVYLGEVLGHSGEARADSSAINIVVLRADQHPFGLVVDEINDTEEIVVKPLGKQLKGVACFAGATIMGDGRVALILDVMGVAQRTHVIDGARDRAQAAAPPSRAATESRQPLLLFEAGTGSRMAIPLSLVARLETFDPGMIEHSGGQEVVQYRGQILPLVRVAQHLPSHHTSAAHPTATEPLSVVVYKEQGRSVGLVVGRICDIVQESITVKRHAHRHNLFGSAVIQNEITDLLDVQALVRAADPTFDPAEASLAA
jgi:two-component system chemotaxis sensor kinase CheA